ncbi:hypothetical protein HDV05_004867 [Chytridiales sp. JEL 0842]|nr:hypothetical protein HDV05_004867 [Chytridiales sp. JEL 0842]
MRLVPDPQAKASVSAVGQNTAYGVNDTFRDGLQTVRGNLLGSHPLEAHLNNWDETQEQLKFSMARNVHGLHAPIRLQMEKTLVSQTMRPPLLKPSKIGLDILSGKDTTIEFEDFLGVTEAETTLLDVHGTMERAYGLSKRTL